MEGRLVNMKSARTFREVCVESVPVMLAYKVGTAFRDYLISLHPGELVEAGRSERVSFHINQSSDNYPNPKKQ